MSDISIERLAEKIYNEKTREYFKEVQSSYFNGNFRSAVVVLYSVVIFDLLYKMRDLRDIYNDEGAEKILVEFEEKQKQNPKDSKWESDLYTNIHQRTKFLSNGELANIKSLHEHRHLSAHPALSHDIELYMPNKDVARAHIRNMLEGVLTKPPIFSKNIFVNLIKDISENASKLPPNDLKRYVNDKYFRNLSDPIINDIFKQLWKFVFVKKGANIDKNREINFKVLKIIIQQNKYKILNYIRHNQVYFSTVPTNNDLLFSQLVKFLCEYPDFYEAFDESAKILTRNKIRSNREYRIRCNFLHEKIADYRKEAEKAIFPLVSKSEGRYEFDKIVKDYIQFLKDNGENFNGIAIKYFRFSSSYNEADRRFRTFIEPYLGNFTNMELTNIVEKWRANSEIEGRERAEADFNLVKSEFVKRGVPLPDNSKTKAS